jgi:hypothetical protein
MSFCKIRKWIPLYAGADLSARKARRLEKHLDLCADCRAVFKEFMAALDGIRAIADRATVDWPKAEWKDLIARINSEQPYPRRRSAPLAAFPKKAFAYGVASVLVFGITFLILRSILSRPTPPVSSEIVAATPAQPLRSLVSGELPSGPYPKDLVFNDQRKPKAIDRAMLATKPAPEIIAQNTMSMTLVSQETGLKVHWTFNRDFEWKETKR